MFSAIKIALSWTAVSNPFRSCWKALSLGEADLFLLTPCFSIRVACFLTSCNVFGVFDSQDDWLPFGEGVDSTRDSRLARTLSGLNRTRPDASKPAVIVLEVIAC